VGERGPLNVSLIVKRNCAGSSFTQVINLSEGSDKIVVNNSFDWQTRGMMVKAEFPLTTGNPLATYDIGLGTVQRGNNKPNLYEVPAQQWADLTQPDGKYGVSILTSGKYGWDKPNNDTLRLTLVRNGQVKESDYQYNNDIGVHSFKYAIYAHEGDWRQGAVREADRFNQPLTTAICDKHPGKLPRQIGFATCDDPRVSIKAIKKAENGNDWIVRVFETTGKPVSDAKITFGPKVLGVHEVNGFETPLSKPTLALKAGANEIVFDMKPYRPRTFAIRLAPLFVTQNKPVQKQIALTFDSDSITALGERAESEAMPAELWPKQIEVGGVSFALAPADRKNSLACQGQKITVPEDSMVILLANSIEGSRSGDLVIGSEPQTRRFYDWTNKGAQTNEISWFGSSLAWVGTHRHDANGANLPYEFCYLYRYEVKVPKGVKTITLPYDSRIRIYGMTAVTRP
jgi:alpha-mannosidase